MKRFIQLLLPLVGIGVALLVWWAASAAVSDLPSPLRTWEESKIYVLEPFEKRGESDQGIALLAFYSLKRVAQGFLLGIAVATPLGFLLGLSKTLSRMFDPVMQVMRPISPLAWLPLGLILFRKSEPAALFAIAVCSMWPTVINTIAGVRAIPQDYWNVAKCWAAEGHDVHEGRDSRDAAHVYRLPAQSNARLVIVASEMLTAPGRRLSVAGINSTICAHLLRSDDRRRGLRAGSADGAG
jgi:ABC-type nitrate/sulfonate/bicarbonate transport system permease component